MEASLQGLVECYLSQQILKMDKAEGWDSNHIDEAIISAQGRILQKYNLIIKNTCNLYAARTFALPYYSPFKSTCNNRNGKMYGHKKSAFTLRTISCNCAFSGEILHNTNSTMSCNRFQAVVSSERIDSETFDCNQMGQDQG